MDGLDSAPGKVAFFRPWPLGSVPCLGLSPMVRPCGPIQWVLHLSGRPSGGGLLFWGVIGVVSSLWGHCCGVSVARLLLFGLLLGSLLFGLLLGCCVIIIVVGLLLWVIVVGGFVVVIVVRSLLDYCSCSLELHPAV